jgi:hypothetical protein
MSVVLEIIPTTSLWPATRPIAEGAIKGGFNLQALANAHIVFAWLDDREAYGTVWKLGYASGRVPIIAVAISHRLRYDDFWFATEQVAPAM